MKKQKNFKINSNKINYVVIGGTKRESEKEIIVLKNYKT